MSESHGILRKQSRQARVFPGARFGRLTVLGSAFRVRYSTKSKSYVVCECDCGTICVVAWGALGGNTKSCGCWNREVIVRRNTKHGHAFVGQAHPLYITWCCMKKRCLNSATHNYHRYGGRGITICSEWTASAGQFIAWAMEHGWKPGLQIDRIDNSAGYSPDNCRFVTNRENSQNTRRNHLVTAFGETKSISAWVDDERTCVKYQTLLMRLYRNSWPPELAITTPASCHNRIKRLRAT